MAVVSPPAPARENPVLKWILGAVQVLFVTFLTWVGGNIASSIKDFSNKLDGVATSIAQITLEQQLQKRDFQDYNKRLSKVETVGDEQGKALTRLNYIVDQLREDRKGGR